MHPRQHVNYLIQNFELEQQNSCWKIKQVDSAEFDNLLLIILVSWSLEGLIRFLVW